MASETIPPFELIFILTVFLFNAYILCLLACIFLFIFLHILFAFYTAFSFQSVVTSAAALEVRKELGN